MTNFPLLYNLQNPAKEEQQPLLPQGHKYQQYDITIENKQFIVHVPLKERQAFEQMTDGEITLEDFNTILRKVRGIRG